MNEKLIKYKDYLSALNQSANYYNIMIIFYKYLDSKQLVFEQITQENLTEFFNTNKYSASTKNQFIKAGRHYGNFLQIPKESNIFYNIKLLKVAYEIPDYLTEEEISQAKSYLKTYHSNIYALSKIDALLSFLYATGVRKAEFLNLKRVDFDFRNNRAKVFGKGQKERYVYFNNKVKKEVDIFFKSEEERINAFNITIGQLHHIMQIIGKYLNKNVYAHLLRHSSAKNMNMKDIPLNIIQKILGHSSITTTMRYTDPDEKMVAEKYKQKMEE